MTIFKTLSHFKWRNIYKVTISFLSMYEEELKEIGLTDNELKIYILLLKNVSLSPAEIAQKLGLHRGYVYDALDRMQEKGFINSILIKNKKQFQAVNPKNLLELIKSKLNNFEKIIPKLIELNSINKEETNVELHKGKKVYRTLLKDIITSLPNGGEVLLIGIDEDLLTKEVEPIYVEQYINSLKLRKIKERAIIKKGNNQFPHPSIKYGQIDPKHIGKTAQIIYANKVAIFITGEPYYLIIIKSKEFAETYKNNFELLWKMAKN